MSHASKVLSFLEFRMIYFSCYLLLYDPLVTICCCYILQISSCLNCNGSGKIITEHCQSCDGSGKVQVEQSIQVDIPGGIEDGSTIRITGGGSVDKQRQALDN